MIDPRQAAHLLKRTFASPGELAKELYVLVTSKAPRVVESPVVIRVAPGQPGLRIEAAPAPAPPRGPDLASAQANPNLGFTSADLSPPSLPPADAGPRAPSLPSAPSVRRPPPAAPGPRPAESSSERLGRIAETIARRNNAPVPASVPAAGRPVSSPAPQESRPLPLPSPAAPTPPPPPPSPTPRTSEPGASRASSVVDPGVSRVLATPSPPRSSDLFPHAPAAYEPPALEVEGSFASSPNQPSRFAVMPTVWSPNRRADIPLDRFVFDQIPGIKPQQYDYAPLLAFVTGGSGKKWTGVIYPFGPDYNSTDDNITVDIIVMNAADGWKAPVNTWVGPIIEIPKNAQPSDDNDYFYILPTQDGLRLAYTTSAIGAATGAAPALTPGSGTANLLTWAGPGSALATGSSVTLYNMSGVVATGKMVQYKYIYGHPFVDVVACP